MVVVMIWTLGMMSFRVKSARLGLILFVNSSKGQKRLVIELEKQCLCVFR